MEEIQRLKDFVDGESKDFREADLVFALIHIKELEECLQEAVILMEDVRTGDYEPDTFTTQPWRQALEGKE